MSLNGFADFADFLPDCRDRHLNLVEITASGSFGETAHRTTGSSLIRASLARLAFSATSLKAPCWVSLDMKSPSNFRGIAVALD